MRSNLLWIFISVLCGNSQFVAQAPLWQWAKEANSPGPEKAWGVAYDSFSGDSYIAGSFNGNLSAVYGNSFISSYGQVDGFVAKYDPQGSVLWAFKIGGTDVEEVKSIATDASGNVYIAGYFRSVCDFDPSAASYTLVPSGGAGQQDGFLAKYDGAGNFLWATRFGNFFPEDVWGLEVDANGIYLTGYYFGLVTFNSASPSVVTKTTTANLGFSEFFGAKYNSSGVVQWVVSGGSQQNDVGYNVVADNNNVYFIGTYQKDINLYNGSGTFSVQLQVASNNNSSIFIAAFTQSTGTLAWATNVGSSNNDIFGNGIALDNTNLYITGWIKGTANFPLASPLFTKTSSGNNDMFLAQLSKSTGVFQWVSSQTCTGGGDEIGLDLALDASSNIILSGYFSSPITFSAGPITFSTSGNEDILISAYSPAGNFLWATKAGANNTDIPHGLATNTTGGIYVAGEHAGATVFGTNTLTSAGSTNIFIAKTGCETASNNTVTSSQTICAGSIPGPFQGSVPTGGNFLYFWEQSSNNSTWLNATSTNTNQNYSPPQLSANTYYRRKVVAGTACNNVSISNTVTVVVNAPPSTSTVGANQALCISAPSTLLSGNVPGVGTGSWSVVSGTATIVTPTLATSQVTSVALGTSVLMWTIKDGVCPLSTSTLSIRVDDIPTTPVAGGSQILCISSNTLLLTGNLPTVGSGTWSVASGSGSLASTASPTTALTNIGLGINKFVWSISNGVCTPLTSTKTIQVDNVPSTATVAGNQTLCINSPGTQLTGNVPTVGSGLWTVQSGNATLAIPGQATSAATVLATGSTVLKWSISNGVCATSSATLNLQVDNLPSQAYAGADQEICSGNTVFTGTVPAIGTGSWLVASGSATIATINSPVSALSGISTGTNSFIWIVSNGSCPSSKDTVAIIRDALPTAANAGSTQILCISSPSTILSGNTPAVGSGSWTVQSGTAAILAPAQATSGVSNLAVGNTVLLWSTSNGVCPVSTSSVLIEVDQLPSQPFAGAAQTVCVNSNSVQLSANAPATGTGLWSVASGSATITSYSLPLTTLINLQPGTFVLDWTVSNGVCASLTSSITIQVDALPDSALAGPNQTLCVSSGSTLLSGNSPGVGFGTWSFLSGSGNLINPGQASSPVSNLSPGTDVMRWTLRNGVCPLSSATMAIQVDKLPTISFAGKDTSLCLSGYTLNGNMALSGIGQWFVIQSSAIVVSPNLPVSLVSGLSPGPNKFAWVITSGSCAPSSDTVVVFRESLPSQAYAGRDTLLCSSVASLQAIQPLTGTGAWSLVTGHATIANVNNASTVVSDLTSGINVFIWKITNGSCPPSTDTILIKTDAQPSPAQAGPDQRVCSSTATLSANLPLIGTGWWTLLSGRAHISDSLSGSSSLALTDTGVCILQWTVKNGICPLSSDQLVIKNDADAGTAYAGPDQQVEIPTVHLSAASPSVGNGSWQIMQGSAVLDNVQNPDAIATFLSAGNTIFRWVVKDGACPVHGDEVTIYLEPLKIPTGFSPNGDGINDTYVIPGVDYYEHAELHVFNRWGGAVYQNNSYKNDWGGTNQANELLADDTYYYTLKISNEMNYKGYIILKTTK